MFRHILGTGIFMDVPDMMNGPADGIQQCGAPADIILLFRHGPDIFQPGPVMKDLRFVVKQNRGYINLSRFTLLLFQHGIKATDGVCLQTVHGTAAIQNEYQFRQILFHK